MTKRDRLLAEAARFVASPPAGEREWILKYPRSLVKRLAEELAKETADEMQEAS